MITFEKLQDEQQKFKIIKSKIKNLLYLCLKKDLTLNVNTHVQNISIYKIDTSGEFVFNYDCYYFGRLSNLIQGNTVTLDDLIKKVKEYKKN